MHSVRYSPQAKEDIQNIRAYIANELKSPIAARDTINHIRDKMDILKRYPNVGEKLWLLTGIDTDYRKLTCGNYLAFYRFDKHQVYVIRILRGNHDWLKLLFGIPSNSLSEDGHTKDSDAE